MSFLHQPDFSMQISTDLIAITSKPSVFQLFIQVVKVWDFDTGRQVSEFIGCHGDASVTCLTFDSSGRRYALSLVS